MSDKKIPTEDELKKRLTPLQYHVLREKGTEMPGTDKYLHDKKPGIYACVVCGNQLFPSNAKFDSGTGWPSFDKAIHGAVKEISDNSSGMNRMEVICANCGSHLGHVFDDGPTETKKRYCMNSVCLDLKDKNEN